MQNTLLVFTFGFLLLLFSSGCQPPPGLADMESSFQTGDCQSCHSTIWKEWARSLHAKSWTNPIYQQMAKDFPNRVETCDPCHSPKPILVTGLGKMPQLRQERKDSGINCLTCHVDSKGAMHGPKGVQSADFHLNVEDPNYAQNPTQLCASCHGQPSVTAHQQIVDWHVNEKKNQNCTSCHMPSVERLHSNQSHEPKQGRKHTWEGSRSLSMLKRSAKLSIHRTGQNVKVTIVNKTGHQLPGDGLRAVILEVTFGSEIRQYIFSAEIAPDGLGLSSDNRLKLKQIRDFHFRIPINQPVKAKLFYRLLPDQDKTKWIPMIIVNG